MKNLSEILKYTKNMTLLYAEDNVSVRTHTMEILKDLFGDIVVAVDGEDAMDKFYENKIDIVFSDINMPNLNGLEMTKMIRDFDDEIPILLNSAHSETNYFTKAIELRVDGYLLKPLQINIFLETLEDIVKKIKYKEEYKNNLAFLKQYQHLTDINTAVSKTDLKGIITYVNNKFCKLSGYSKEELIGESHNIVRHPDAVASTYSDLWHTIKKNKEQWSGILKNKTKDGSIYYADVNIKPILDKDENIVEYISLKRDVTVMMSPRKQLHDFVESSNNPLLVLIKTDGFIDIEKFYGYTLSQDIDNSFAERLYDLMPKNLGFKKFLALGTGQYAFIKDDLKDDIETIANELKLLQTVKFHHVVPFQKQYLETHLVKS